MRTLMLLVKISGNRKDDFGAVSKPAFQPRVNNNTARRFTMITFAMVSQILPRQKNNNPKRKKTSIFALQNQRWRQWGGKLDTITNLRSQVWKDVRANALFFSKFRVDYLCQTSDRRQKFSFAFRFFYLLIVFLVLANNAERYTRHIAFRLIRV